MTSLMRTLLNPLVVVAFIACLATLFIAQSASAHANLLESSPKPSEELDAAPERVIIWFTEPIEPAFSTITVLNPGGANVTAGDTEFDPTEPSAMWVPLAPLENGTYTVVWRNVSSVDGHRVTGSFLFAVGEPLGAGAELAVVELPLIQSPFDPIVRWIIYISIAIFTGGLLFDLVIATRFAHSQDEQHTLLFTHHISTRFATIALIAIVVLIFTQIAQLILQTTLAFDVSIFSIEPLQLVEVVSQSDWGRFWSWRFNVGILAALALLAALQSVRRARLVESDEVEEYSLVTETIFGIAALALGGVYLILISLTSHNAAVPSDIKWLATASDFVHIIAATTWVGGIGYLSIASFHVIRADDLPSRTALLQLATGFAPLAILSTTILVASGVVLSLMQVTIPEALNTPYGRVLGMKVVLLFVLIALAIRNNRSVANSADAQTSSTRSLGRYITVELGVTFAVLLATAGLASLEPARQYAERQGIGVSDYVGHSETISGAIIDVKLDPGKVGANTLMVDITDDDGVPFSFATETRARLKYLDDDFGEYFVPLEEQSVGRWGLDDVTIGVAGAYQLDVTVVRSDSFDSHTSTRFSASSSTFASDLLRPTFQTAMSAFGILIAIAGLAYLAVTVFITKPKQVRTVFNPRHAVAVLIAVIGVGLVLNTFTVGLGFPAEGNGNPHPLTQESVDMGRDSYVAVCSTCHGDAGSGDGPVGVALNPAPADLMIHVPLHTDSELYGFIADGIEGTVMVAQLGNLTSDEIWHLVNYIRTISQ